MKAACGRRQEIADSRSELVANEASFDKAKELILSFPKLLGMLSYQNRLELVQKIVARVYVSENKVYVFPFDRIKRWEQGKNRVTSEQWEKISRILREPPIL